MSEIGSSDGDNVHRPSLCDDNMQAANQQQQQQATSFSNSSATLNHHNSFVTPLTAQTSHLKTDICCGDQLFTTGIPIQGAKQPQQAEHQQHQHQQEQHETRPNKSTSDSITPGSTPVESSMKRLKPIDGHDVDDDEDGQIVASTSSYRPTNDGNSTTADNADNADNADGDAESDYVTIGSSDEEDDLSDVSSLSGLNWKPKPVTGLNNWVQRRMCDGSSPREILNHMLPNYQIPDHLDEMLLWQIILSLLNEPASRKKLTNYNTIDDAVNLIKNSKNIIVLTGAGVSTSSGIPDFRSRDGLYARLNQDFPDLPPDNPQSMFDIAYFKRNPRPFFKFAKEIYPGQYQPAIGHYFIKCLEKHESLLRNYTQNIDTLEQVAGIQRVITCHGSFASASCTNCKYQVDASIIKDDIFEQRIPKCPRCRDDTEEVAVMKPDIVFFGEGLPDTFHDAIGRDKDECDLLIVIGSSMKVRPVALIPSSIPDKVPQILINREPLGHLVFDIELLGDCDEIIQEICMRLGEDWSEICTPGAERLAELTELPVKNDFDSAMPPATDDTQAMETGDQDQCKNTTEQQSGLGLTTNDEENISASLAPSTSGHGDESRVILKGSSVSQADDNNDNMGQSECGGFGSAVAEAASPAASSDLSSNDGHDNVASQLPPASYLYVAPSRYIFKGAEISMQTLEKYRKKNSNQVDEDPAENKPTVPKHIAHIASDSSTFSSVGSSMANSSDSSSSPDCSSIDRSPMNISAPSLGPLKGTTLESSNSSSVNNTLNVACDITTTAPAPTLTASFVASQGDTGMHTESSQNH